MYKVELYEDERGFCEIKEWLKELHDKSKTSKDARVNFTKVTAYIDALEELGTRIGAPVTKHLKGEIWELRPLSNRILYAYYDENTFAPFHKEDPENACKRNRKSNQRNR